MTNNNKTCIISDKNTTNTIILFPKTDQTTEVTGQSIIIRSKTNVTSYSLYAAFIGSRKADENKI